MMCFHSISIYAKLLKLSDFFYPIFNVSVVFLPLPPTPGGLAWCGGTRMFVRVSPLESSTGLSAGDTPHYAKPLVSGWRYTIFMNLSFIKTSKILFLCIIDCPNDTRDDKTFHFPLVY